MWGIGDQTGQPETFGEVFGFQDLFPLQSSTVNMVTKLEGPSLVLIEGPMGQGKTEAAMFLENYWRRTLDNRGAYVALPTQATANQMFHRIRLYLEHASFDGYVNLHLLHGYAALSPEYAQLRTQNSVSDDSQTVVAVQWFSSQKKRAILSSYGVGTVDQALMAVLPSKHFFVRLFGLAGKTVVVDEVHAYDLYTSTLLEILLSWLSALGCSVVVLSATLPRKRSAELIYAYSGGEPLPSVGAYPRISWASKSGVGSQTIESTGRKVEVLLDWIEDNHDALTALFTDLLRDGGHAALICSTISRAQDMYQAIEGPLRKAGIEVDLFHARFPLEDRLAKENTCISSFGKKERDPSKKHLLIATQVIEQSLDLDFDLIVSDIAPVDLLLQRIGRLHRHPGHRRPLLLTCPRLYIVEPQLKEGNPTFGDSSFVYWESTLLSTYAHLLGRDKITTPTDIEELVEAVYPPTLPNGSPLPWVERLEELNRERETALSSEEYMARSAVIPSPREGKVWRDIPRYLEEEDDEMHVSLQARTRLIRPGVSLVCLYAIGSQTYLDELGTVPITQKELGSQEMQRNLLNRTVRIDKPSIVFGFRKRPKSDLEIALDRTPLRGHRIVAFPLSEGGNVFRSEIEGHPIRLSKELGIVLANEERTE
ncbi:MAG TPA: CRISPR-associated helicase Cas3' [Methanomassiliicoccales archaeon]|jgi:CRISPR-associated endonuclease/helicase Cas3